jgi:hypothetical protein
MHAVRPAKFNHVSERNIRVRKVPDGFYEGAGFLCQTRDRGSGMLSEVY